jgi:hypothetical protein
MDLTKYTERYPPQPPSKPAGTPDEHRQLTVGEGLGFLPEAAAAMTPAKRIGDREGRHLWAIVPSDVRVILEVAPGVKPPPLTLGVAKHTNLTGGGPASCGGEVWLDPADPRKLYATGGSGRYPPRTPAQLEDAIEVFLSFGFEVISAGWSEDNDCPQRVFR